MTIRPIILQDLESYALNILTFYLVYFKVCRKKIKVKKPRLFELEIVNLRIRAVGYDHPAPLS